MASHLGAVTPLPGAVPIDGRSRPALLCRSARPLTLLSLSVLLSACATLGGMPAPQAGSASTASTAAPSAPAKPSGSPPGTPPTGAGNATTVAAATAAAAAAQPGAAPGTGAQARPQPFEQVIKGATRHDGWLPMWERDGQWWLELSDAHWGTLQLLSVNITRSVGERGLYASQMGPRWMVSFQRVGTQAQVVARNVSQRASGDEALGRMVQESYSDSLLASLPVLSTPQADTGAVLVDAAFLLGDLPGYTRALERAFRINYQPDGRNSRIDRVNGRDRLTSVHTTVHYATGRIPVLPPQQGNRSPSPGTVPSPPSSTPDPRSFFVSFAYSFLKLPDEPMRTRAADPRVGHFTESYTDLSLNEEDSQRVHPIRRWRLDKRDPQAAISPPVQPIVFVLDRNIPLRWRDAVEEGVLAWNEAFERIGISDAIVTVRQPPHATGEGMEAGRASVRWYSGVDASSAIGPSHTDPRTGEILSAHIAISDSFTRGARRLFVDQVSGLRMHGEGSADMDSMPTSTEQRLAHLTAPWRQPGAWLGGQFDRDNAACTYALQAHVELAFAMDLLTDDHTQATTGQASLPGQDPQKGQRPGNPDTPLLEVFIRDVIKDLTMHEVGHTLGLRHNFKASLAYTPQELRDPAFTARHGISASVMDYNAANLPLPGEPPARIVNAQLGAYDFWAIEYAYAPLPAEQEAAGLARIAARAAQDPLLAYADDADAGGFGGQEGMDPTANRFDLSSDPLAHAQRRVAMARHLWQRAITAPADSARAVQRQRRVLGSGFAQLRGAAAVAVKHVGGMTQDRSRLGDPDNSPGVVYRPVAPALQAQALALVTDSLFRSDSFQFPAEFLASLPPDHLERSGPGPVNIPAAVLGLQEAALDRLMGPGTATRLLDLPSFDTRSSSEDAPSTSLAAMYGSLQAAIWSELPAGQPIDRLRRNLQREHLLRMQRVLLDPPSSLPADAISLMRLHAQRLQVQLQRAVRTAQQRRLPMETQAHLQESRDRLGEALRASMTRR